jgi:hypothetical protein
MHTLKELKLRGNPVLEEKEATNKLKKRTAKPADATGSLRSSSSSKNRTLREKRPPKRMVDRTIRELDIHVCGR